MPHVAGPSHRETKPVWFALLDEQPLSKIQSLSATKRSQTLSESKLLVLLKAPIGAPSCSQDML